MRTTFRLFYHVILIVIFAISIADAASKIAVATKVRGKAEVNQNKGRGFQKLKPGTVLEDGDRIKTGSDGYVAVIFIDDKSMLKLKEDTEVEITGKRTATNISKKIYIDVGTIKAQVRKQQKGEFVIQTPTSVASVKGTDFWVITNPFTGDILITIDGAVTFTNSITGESIIVTAGNTGFSTLEGALSAITTDPSDIPEDPDEGEEEGGFELKIRFEGPNGEEKTILIHYQ